MKHISSRYISTLFCLIGIIFFIIAGYLIWQHEGPLKDLVITNNASRDQTSDPAIVSIVIKDINISAPITSAFLGDNGWEISQKSVVVLSNPEIFGDRNNLILYGHNWQSLLGNLYKIQSGDEIAIGYSDGTTKTFTTTSKTIVKPNDLSLLESSDLIVYTCYGFLDSKRLVVSAKLIE